MPKFKIGQLVEVADDVVEKQYRGLRLRVVKVELTDTNRSNLNRYHLSYSANSAEEDYGRPLCFFEWELKEVPNA